ncbi:histidine kinase N-terminal 7TM domain-containing protein [Halorarum salinum]|uniref:histidine kinase n=1 Tax=Halorarum salinum TaxID=2743089 RepID=A0A7D5LCF6_9EURY|nr:histidine kinase N-terminal 7TM domain-containing protein [Halobaculum salinum]QLG62669.1 PAS domain-containing protein [Halobaculum salinum]
MSFPEPFASGSYLPLLGLAATTSVATAVGSWRYRNRTGGGAYVVLTTAVSVWVLADLLGYLSSTLPRAMLAHRLTYLAISVVPVAWVVLALRYVGRSDLVTRRRVGLLCVVPALTLLVSLTNGHHGMLWEVHGLSELSGMTTLSASSGPWFWVHTLYSYALLVVGAGVFVRWSLRGEDVRRPQSAAVLGAVALPWATNVLYVTGVVALPVDATPASFTAACVLLWVGLFRYGFLDVVPVARNRVVEEMREGVVVLNERDRVVDVNPSGRRLIEPDSIVGRPIGEVFAEESVERFGDVVDGGGRIGVERDGRRRHFDVHISPLSTGGGDRVVIFHDVTDEERSRKRLAERTRELERQNERLDRFASVLGHDIRNPLAVARGWTDVIADGDVDDEALSRVERAHDRIETIVDDTLALARSGDDPDPVPVELRSLAREAWANVESDAPFEADVDVVVLVDRALTLRALENLLRNAVEHGGEGVSVRVGGFEAGDDSAGFYVEDDGPGIPEGIREDAFEYGTSGETGGTGLGLAIVRDVAEAHGWGVRFESSDAGGARVVVEGVPLAGSRRTFGSA